MSATKHPQSLAINIEWNGNRHTEMQHAYSLGSKQKERNYLLRILQVEEMETAMTVQPESTL